MPQTSPHTTFPPRDETGLAPGERWLWRQGNDGYGTTQCSLWHEVDNQCGLLLYFVPVWGNYSESGRLTRIAQSSALAEQEE